MKIKAIPPPPKKNTNRMIAKTLKIISKSFLK